MSYSHARMRHLICSEAKRSEARRSAGGSPAGPPAARWRVSGIAAEPAAVQPARPPALRLAALLFLAGCASASLPLPKGWETVPVAASIGDYCASFKCAAKAQAPSVRVSGNRIVNGDKALTPQFVAIDSFDVSLDRK